jgi:hypothetical protein
MSSAPTPADIARDAGWLAQALDPAAAMLRVIAMDRQAYRDASFLDDRMLEKPHSAGIVPWTAVAGALPADARRDARWIFHIGHVGSTLMSRLLGEVEDVLAVREPRILRDLAFTPPEVRAGFIPAMQALMSRTFGAQETALIKATSLCSEIAGELMPEDARALFLFAEPRAYVATILAGENSRRELDFLAEPRRQRIAARGIALADERKSMAHLAAAAWACEMTALEATAEERPDAAVAWRDFDAMLDDMAAALGDVAAHLGFTAKPDRIAEIASGPLMRRYSKALEYDYSPQLRRELLYEATQANGADIDAAMAMLESATGEAPLLARALGRGKRRMECTESCPS